MRERILPFQHAAGKNMDSSERASLEPPASPGRIPAELRAVFLASQQGQHELCPVPPNLLAASTWPRPANVPQSQSQPQPQPQQRKRRASGVGASTSSAASSGGSSGAGGCAATNKSEPQRRYISRKHPVGCGARAGERRSPALFPANRSTAAATAQVPLCPQLHLDALVRSRGYCARRFQSLQTAYFCDPTPLQVASYQAGLVDLVRRGDLAAFRRVLAGGLVSPNPCNRFGESLVHTVCRLGEAPFLRALLDCGATVDVCDDRGRTPLHDACWVPSPRFDVVDLILERDPRLLFVADCRGATPLQYVPRKDWGGWVRFLEGRKDVYWPPRDARRDGPQPPPPLALLKPNARPVPDPPRSLGPDRARLAASGEDGGSGSGRSDGRGSATAAGSTAAAPPLSLSLVTLRHAGSLGSLLLSPPPPPPGESRGGAGAATPAGAAAAAAGGGAEEAAAMVSDEPEEGAEPGSGGGGDGGDDSSLSSSASSSCPPSPSSDCDDDDDDSSDSDDSATDESDERLLREMAGRIAGAGALLAPR
jgi:hypothetical protein